MKYISAFLLSFFLLFASVSQAHKIKTAFSIVLFNERTGNLEAVHRFYLHDAEEAVWALFDKNADIIGNEKTQATFSKYVTAKFALKNQNGDDIKMNTLGFQNEGGYFWIYQETPMPKELTTLYIKQDALKDVWPEQFNVVNVEGLQQVYSLSFSDRDQWLSIKVK